LNEALSNLVIVCSLAKMMNTESRNMVKSKRLAFSLVELVVVVLIIGILAAVAAPRMFDTASDARDSATRASLGILRDAVELHRAQNGTYPTVANITTALRPFIKGPFPRVQTTKVPTANQTATVIGSTADPIAPVAGTAGWVYNETNGDIAVNGAACITW
jgi:general secretion pathway protein G